MIRALDALRWSFQQLPKPKVFSSVLVPCLIHSCILIGALFFVYTSVSSSLMGLTSVTLPEQVAWFQQTFEILATVIMWILVLGVVLGTLAFGLSMATAVAHFLASPFNGWLSSAAESQLRPVSHPELSLRQATTNGLARELKRMKYWLSKAFFLGVLTVVCFWVPVVNSLIGLLWSGFGAWMIGLQAVDYVADNNGYSFDETLGACKKSRLQVMALGGCIMLMMVVPLLNLLSMAVSVLAGTYLWVRIVERKGLQS